MNQKNYLNTRKIYQKTKIKIDQRAVLYHVPGALNCKGNIHARKSQINPHSQNKNQAHGIPTTYRIKVLTYIHVSYIASASKRIISTREKLNLYEYNRRLLHLPKKKLPRYSPPILNHTRNPPILNMPRTQCPRPRPRQLRLVTRPHSHMQIPIPSVFVPIFPPKSRSPAMKSCRSSQHNIKVHHNKESLLPTINHPFAKIRLIPSKTPPLARLTSERSLAHTSRAF